jgi:acyl dehydratase
MALSRVNWGAIGTFLFVLFVLGVLAFEQVEPAVPGDDVTAESNADAVDPVKGETTSQLATAERNTF